MGKKILRIAIGLGIIVLQLIMTQIVTLLVSFVLPDMEGFQKTNPGMFVLVVGLTFTAGVFLTGWLAIKLRWLKSEPKVAERLVATLVGAYLPLLIALLAYPTLEPGNPFYTISMLASVLGFYLPGWIRKV